MTTSPQALARALRERLDRTRSFIQDTMDTQHVPRGAIGNLMSARDEVDATVANLTALVTWALEMEERNAELERVREVGWLIELKPSVIEKPHWFQLEDEWTADASKALRFARKQDADAFIAHIGWTEAFASEHEWSDPPRHEWWEWNGLTCCKSCGMVRRADGGNDDAICKGPAKIGLRSAIAGKQP